MGYRPSDETVAGRLRKVVQLDGGAELLANYFNKREDQFAQRIVSNTVDSNLISELRSFFQEIASNDPDLEARNSAGRRTYAARSAGRSEEYLRTATAVQEDSALAYKDKLDALRIKLQIA